VGYLYEFFDAKNWRFFATDSMNFFVRVLYMVQVHKKIKIRMFKFLLHILLLKQICLNKLMDDCHLGYITKLGRKKTIIYSNAFFDFIRTWDLSRTKCLICFINQTKKLLSLYLWILVETSQVGFVCVHIIIIIAIQTGVRLQCVGGKVSPKGYVTWRHDIECMSPSFQAQEQ
jgi:hypothetical protein